MSSSTDNLKAAFAGESQANRKYLFFAAKAEEEGLRQVARLFRAAADAETVHARAHLRVLGGVKSTRENLQAAIEGESYEFTKMYPEFIKRADAEGNQAARNSFDLANKVEQVHHALYAKALDAVQKGRVLPDQLYHVCQVCGMTVEGEAPEKCPVCGASKKQFKKID
ncbi:MAG: rubrerythrin family protein [Chloroflexota bacterium]